MKPPPKKGDIMTIIAVPKILREKLTEEGTNALVELMNKVEERSQLAILEIADERCEKRLAQLDGKIEAVAARLDAKIDGVANSLGSKIEALEKTLTATTDSKIEKLRANIIQWMFIFWIGQVGTTILLTYFKR